MPIMHSNRDEQDLVEHSHRSLEKRVGPETEFKATFDHQPMA